MENAVAKSGQLNIKVGYGPPALSKNEAFVLNLPIKTTKTQIKAFFRDCGTIKNIRMLGDRTTCQFKGMAYIEFNSRKEIDNALKKNNTSFDDSIIKVDYGRGKQVPHGCNGIFINHLSPDVNATELKEFFSDCGVVRGIRMLSDKKTGKFNGKVIINFEDPGKAARLAHEKNGIEFMGKPIIIDYSKSK